MLKLENISAGYRFKPCIRNINAEFVPGRHTAVLGGICSGKTTFLKTAAGLHMTISGQVFYDNLPITEYSRKELLRGVTYVPQDHFAVDVAVSDFLLICRTPSARRNASASDMDAVSFALSSLDLSSSSLVSLKLLSPALLTRVYLAAALVQNSRFILIDEPSAFLSKGEKQDILHAISTLKALGKTIILAESDPGFAEQCCEDFFVLADGMLTCQTLTKRITLEPSQQLYM